MLLVAFFQANGASDGHVAQNGFVLVAHPGARAKPVGHDRNQSATRDQATQCRLQMANSGIVVSSAADGP